MLSLLMQCIYYIHTSYIHTFMLIICFCHFHPSILWSFIQVYCEDSSYIMVYKEVHRCRERICQVCTCTWVFTNILRTIFLVFIGAILSFSTPLLLSTVYSIVLFRLSIYLYICVRSNIFLIISIFPFMYHHLSISTYLSIYVWMEVWISLSESWL